MLLISGGFLAKDWCDSFEVGPLARKSFELHEQLAKEFGNTDYRKLNTLSVTAKVTFSVQRGARVSTGDFPFVSGSALQPLQDCHLSWVVLNLRHLVITKLWCENVELLHLYSWLQEGAGKKQEDVPDWLDGDIIDTHSLGTTTTTAQVMKCVFTINVVL